MKRYYLFSIVLNLSLLAQDTPAVLRGEVTGYNPTDHLFVEVYEMSRRSMVERVPLLGDGRFEVGGVQAGGRGR